MEEKIIKLKTSDNELIEVSNTLLTKSKLLNGLIDEDEEYNTIFLININNKAILENVIKYLEHFKDFEPKEIPKPFPEMADDQFFRSC